MSLVEFLTAARRTLWPQQYNKFCESWPRIADDSVVLSASLECGGLTPLW